MCNFNVSKIELEVMQAAGIPTEEIYAISVATAIKCKTLLSFNVYSFIETLFTTLANPAAMSYDDYNYIKGVLSKAERKQDEIIFRNQDQADEVKTVENV